MTGPAVDPLADYDPGWRKKLQQPDPLADYSPDWRAQAQPGGLPGLAHNPIESFGEFAGGFAGGVGKGMLSIPEGAASVLFAPQSAEEQASPIAQGYAAAKVGLPPAEPATPEGWHPPMAPPPGPFQQALEQAKGLATFPVTAVKDILQPPGTMEQQGERAANVYMAAEGVRHLGGKGVEAYREGKAKSARIEGAAGDPLAAYTPDWREKIGEGLAPPREEMAEGGQAVSAPPAPPPRLETPPPIGVHESAPETLGPLPEQGAALPPSRQLTAGEPTVTPPVSRETPPGPIEAAVTGKKVKPAPKVGASATGPVGAETTVQLHQGEPLRARYRVLEAGSLRTSHDPFNFAPTAGYPEGVQGRDYLRNKGLQETVRARALAFDPERALNPSRSATEGQPIVLPDGTVLAGNERAMLPRLASRRAPGRYAAYRKALEERAQQFGLDPAQVAAMREPVLVRELTSAADLVGGASRWAEINRLSDIPETKAKSAVEEGAARAQALNQAHDALRHFAATIGPEETVSQYLGGAEGRTFVRHLLDAGVLTKEELGRFTAGEGTLTGEGREAIRGMMMGSAVREPGVLVDAPPAVVGKLEHAVPNIVALRGTAYDPSPLLTEALRLVGEARAKGLTLRDLAGQGDLLTETGVPRLVRDFAGFLEQHTKLQVSEAFRKFGTIARETIAAEGDMLGGTGYDPPSAFREAFGLEAPFQAAMGGGKRVKGSDPGEMSLFGDQEVGGMFSPTGAAGPVGSRPAGYQSAVTPKPEPSKPAPAPTLPGKFTPEEIAAQPERVQSEELGGLTEHAPGQQDIFEAGMGGGRRKVGPIQANLRATVQGKTPPLPEALPSTQRPILPKPTEVKEAMQTLLAPSTLTEGSRGVEGIIRYRNAARAHDVALAEHRMKDLHSYAAKLSREEQFALDDAIEHGRELTDPHQAELAKAFRELLDTEARKIQAAAPGKLQVLIEDYLPHIWTDPAKAREVIAKMGARRPLKGSQSFLKHRTIATMREGLEAGLVPVTYNPVELALLKYKEMRRFRMAAEILQDTKRPYLKFVHSSAKPPSEMVRINDPSFSVFGPPTIKVQEAFDANVREGLQKVIASLPKLEHIRKANIGGGRRWGYAESSGEKMATKFGGENFILTHELGHILDFRWGLWDRLVKPAPLESHTFKKGKRAGETIQRAMKQERAEVDARKEIREELRRLADLRYEGKETSEHYKKYVRDKYEQIANAIHARIHAPEKMREVAPTVYANLTRFLQENEKLRPLLDIKPGLRLGADATEKALPGFPLIGHYYAEPPVARVFNNFLSPGLRGNPLYDTWMGAGNTLNQAQLGLSAFHLGFTTFDVTTSKLALAIEQLATGRVGAAAKSVAGIPVAPITNILRGMKVRREYLEPGKHPELGPIVKMLEQGGGRVLQEAQYRNNSVQKFLDAIHERAIGHAAAYSLPALLELAAAPIMEHIVPMQKLGVFADLMAHEMKGLPKDATAADVQRVSRKVWDSVDNRLGQLVYDNLFWNKTFKDLLHASIRAVGWDHGTLRELGGGALDLGRGRLTHRSAYFVALPIMVGVTGAVLGYLYTGKGPASLKDYFYPRTGQKNEDGNDERVQLPTYMKDIVGYARHPVQTVAHKAHPLVGLVGEMLSNEDFYGNQIRNPHDPMLTQLEQEAKHLLAAIEPLGFRNVRQQGKEGQSLATRALNFVGITPAPREMVRTEAQQRMAEVMATRGSGGATPEQAKAQQRRKDIGAGFRRGDIGVEALTDSMHAGAITAGQRKNILRSKDQPAYVARFKQLSWDDAEQVYARATPEERSAWWPLLARKRVLTLKQLRMAGVDDERVAALRAAIHQHHPDEPPGEPITARGGE